MGWIEKESSSPFDTQSIPGLYFLDGDYFSRTRHTSWTEHKTYPTIMFPSGAQCDIDRHPEPANATVHIFGALDVPLVDTNTQALAEARAIAKQHWYLIEPIQDHSFIVTGEAENAVIAYDPVTHQLNNVLFLRNGEPTRYAVSNILTDEVRERLPPHIPHEPLSPDMTASVRYVLPDTHWTWYATAFDGIDTFFGLVVEDTVSSRSFSLADLARLRSPQGSPVAYDYDFEPATLRSLTQMHERTRRNDKRSDESDAASFPTNWVSYEDVISIRPDLADSITVGDIERAASTVGDILQEFYWDVLETFLEKQFPLPDVEQATDEQAEG